MAVMSEALPAVAESLRPGLCISNHPQEKTYLAFDENAFRAKRTYQCVYYCMNIAGGIDAVPAVHSQTVWFGFEDGDEFLCLGMKTKWIETAGVNSKGLGYYTVTGAAPFSPVKTRNRELREWYRNQ